MNKEKVMNCQEAQPFVSSLHDGEGVPEEAASHINACSHCRELLHAYSQMGAELRLLASRTHSAAVLPPTLLKTMRSADQWRKLSFVTGKVLVPRFALILLAGILVAFSASLMMLHAQGSRRLWFQFQLNTKNPHGSDQSLLQHAVQAGFDDTMVVVGAPPNVVGVHLAISAIKDDSVELALRSRRYSGVTNADQIHVKEDLGNLNGHTLIYHPGTPLEIPVEGGGTLVLQGHIADHQPKSLPFGIPLEPDPDQLVLSSPVLIRGNTVLINMKGANALAKEDEAGALYAPNTGLFRFALRPFPGAVQGQAGWGNLEFKLDGQNYFLLTASPMCGGDQPRTIWISHDPQFSPADKRMERGFLAVDSLSASHFSAQ